MDNEQAPPRSDVMNMRLTVIASAIASLAISLITGLIDVTPMGLVGSRWHGWPIAWFYVIVYPGSPVSINWLNLISDVIIWFVIALIIALVVLKLKTSKI